ncbi:uncharacterized protein LOC105169928 [Sesamum indicum]|uniref:Uncharacterized protein LOC105169928 n=1 Tax=Sesamum indicum TaxID=4182 RepID=A0A6I9TY04_SESIN|nr:uncharacterized protein LOC105169928 [Sesamum indicum]
MALDYMLIDAESVTISLLESMLSHVTGTKVQARKPGWSLVSKLMLSKKGSYQGEETDLNEFEKVDAVLQMSREDNTQVDEFLNHLKRMDSSIQILEEELELLFRKYQNQKSVTSSLLESLLSYAMGTKLQARKSGWSLVQELANILKEMESSIQILEEELEFMFRQLIKTSVFLLNILKH